MPEEHAHERGVPASAWSRPGTMAALSPMYPDFPFRFRNVSVLTTFYRTSPDAAARFLPAPLASTGDVVAIQIYNMPEVEGIGAVHECNVMVGATLDIAGGPVAGGFSCLLLIDSDTGLAHGREVHGQPKKLARVTLETRGDLVVGAVERNGIDVVTVTSQFARQRAGIEDMRPYLDVRTNLNHKVVPAIDGGAAISQITSRRLSDVVVDECWVGPASVELRPNAAAPVWLLPVVEPLVAFFWRADFTLVEGRVLHNYLADGLEAG